MSLTKKDPSLRVAANDPHLVSLGGGRLSTAVTIHHIPIGDTTIGSATTCSLSLNGTGVRPTHCTIYRSEENEVTIVPECDARILIDGTKISEETNLTQGAMITIGNSNYLRFNNPAEAQMIRSAMGSNERISMPQIDFTQVSQRDSSKSITSNKNEDMRRQSMEIENFYETNINPMNNIPPALTMSLGREPIKSTANSLKDYIHIAPIDINSLECPKVFTADLVTVNMPAKDVLGQKYASFAKNLAENHRNDKHIGNGLRNNQVNPIKAAPSHASNGIGNYVNIPSNSNFIQNSNLSSLTNGNRTGSAEYLTKVNNTAPMRNAAANQNNHHNQHMSPYDRYPKPGGGMQIYPMNGINTEINNSSLNSSPHHQKSSYEASPLHTSGMRRNLSSIESEHLEDMLKICTEYSDRQNQSNSSSMTSSPIVQNRIKTNGSLPRDKKSPFHFDVAAIGSSQLKQSLSGSNGNLNGRPFAGGVSSGYENVRLLGPNRVEINGQMVTGSSKLVYENVVVGKYVPQSPRTKIRTTCISPKKEHSFNNNSFGLQTSVKQPPPPNPKPSKQNEYDQLIRTFEEKMKLDMQAIQENYQNVPNGSPMQSTNFYTSSTESSPAKRTNINIKNLSLNLKQPISLQNSPKLPKKPAPAPRFLSKSSSGSSSSLLHISVNTKPDAGSLDITKVDVEQLKKERKRLLACVARIKRDISELQKQESEILHELDVERALVSAELESMGGTVVELEAKMQNLQGKIHRLEAQRNATRVMEENQQAKLKHSIEMKQDQVKKLKIMLKQKPDGCLKEDLHNLCESLENDKKLFEDLEFQYLEEESEWHAYHEELHVEKKELSGKIEEQRQELKSLEKQELTNQTTVTRDARKLKTNLIALFNELKSNQESIKSVETTICDITGELNIPSSDEDDQLCPSMRSIKHQVQKFTGNLGSGGCMSQSLFGSAELLCPKRSDDDIMSKSVNENMFYNNKIELPSAQATSTPKQNQLKVIDIPYTSASGSTTEPGNNENRNSPKNGLLSDTNKSLIGDTGEVLSEGERIKFNLSLGSDDFEVNPLEQKRAASQDDIDRISKVTSDAPISTKGATNKIFDSIKEIERNRQLLLAQQGHHVIEHERQKMHDLKKRIHDEARAQYLSMLNDNIVSCSKSNKLEELSKPEGQELQRLSPTNQDTVVDKENVQHSSIPGSRISTIKAEENSSQQQRHSQPEFESHHAAQLAHTQRLSPRPLSEANSELSCDLLAEHNINSKSSIELSTGTTGIGNNGSNSNRQSGDHNITGGDDAGTKRSSVNSNGTASGGSIGHGNERKRTLPKHQRPLTRYLPIFSPDLNLRHHIESAGHQIQLCPYVFVDSYSCRGYLHKLGATFHGWARRWFVLDRQRNAFIYYADKSERKPRGGAYFSTIDEVYLDHLNASKSGRPHCTLIVKTKKRSYHLQAASDATARIWIDAIITGAQGNLEY